MKAWDLIDYDGHDHLRIVGGRALYDTVIYYDNTPGNRVKLARLDSTGATFGRALASGHRRSLRSSRTAPLA